MHADQLPVSLSVVRELVDEQFPSWRHLAIIAVQAAGTVNAIFRIGDRFAAWFSLRPGDAALVRRRLGSEAAAARELAGRTRFATPEPAAIGEPGTGYPLAWAVQTWLPGVTATDNDPGRSVAFAHESGRPDPGILSHRELCCWGGASLAAGQPLPDSGTLALAMLFWLPG
jgi:aminoglycoside phosphotransferase (APT) family kinase protein